jgi:hypothetical protein
VPCKVSTHCKNEPTVIYAGPGSKT